ncbi:MAG: phosphoribosylformylglycinamidine cyclo-ligase [Candidatus Cloacimonadaceae bacterium]|nr:phosphoribosylformylglycinamidine cyclo-ligase [Candidatus Cloacimonadaceae bacterium]
MSKIDYKSAGVDILAGEQAVLSIKQMVKSTYNQNVMGELGSFGGLYRFDQAAYQQPILVSSTDGVGTKLRVAIMAKRFDTIGQDLVNHCVNDILVQGAQPLFFLDYIGLARMKPDMVSGIIGGMVNACKANGCALIGGEMAEMPGIYHEGDFDLVGTIVGVVDQANLLPSGRINKGDILLGIPSSGLHTNGYSLARKIIFEHLKLEIDSYVQECGASVAELLLSVHRSYLSMIRPYLTNPSLHGLAHITGGGIPGNLKRIIPEGLSAIVTYHEREYPPLFRWLQQSAAIDNEVMLQSFNLGIGMIAVVEENLVQDMLADTGAIVLGEIAESRSGQGAVQLV